MKHKHAEMIKTKADNMELVLFSMSTGSDYGKWSECKRETMPKDNENIKYFLCLPQHKEACLHWLNGGESQYFSNGMKDWINFGNSTGWSDTHLLMTTECELRIKPKKEKRLIVYRNDVVYGPYLSIDDINTDFVLTGQVVEIEVEV